MIEKFITFKDPVVIEGTDNDGIIFRTHVKLTSGVHLMISECKRKNYIGTSSFLCSEDGKVTSWERTLGNVNVTTEDIMSQLNEI